jgi:DnaJ-class molecular chaperone
MFGRGDQIVLLTVLVPKKLTSKQRRLIEELDKEMKKEKNSWWKL